MRSIAAAVAVALALPCTALATSREEAQQKMDAAKVKGCESAKATVIAQKDSCPDEAKAAEALTCSATTWPDAQKLDHACTEKIKAGLKATGDKAAAEKGGAAATDPSKQSCQGVGTDGVVLAEATGSYSDCANAVRAAVVAKKCDGKTGMVEYKFVRGKNSITMHASCDK